MSNDNLRHLHALRSFIKNLIEQAERSTGCECSRPPSLLLVGPTGAGKTFLVKQLSKAVDMPLFGVHAGQLADHHELRHLFINSRKPDYPSLFFLDDANHLTCNQNENPGCSSRLQEIRKELFSQLGHRKLKINDPKSGTNPVKDSLKFHNDDGQSRDPDNSELPDNDGLIVVAATSSPWELYNDHALLSRFRGVYLVGLPDLETRYNILKQLLNRIQHNLTDNDLWIVAEKTEGFTPADFMVAVKNLNFRQVELYMAMLGDNYEVHYSDDSTDEDSDVTEADTESEFEIEQNLTRNKLAQMMATPDPSMMPYLLRAATGANLVRNSVPSANIEPRVLPTMTVPMKSNMPIRSAPKSEMENRVHGWNDDQQSHEPPIGRPQTTQNISPNSSSHSSGCERHPSIECNVPSPDSALGLSKSSEDDIETMTADVARELFSSFQEDTPCDSNLSNRYHAEDDVIESSGSRTLDQCSDLISKCISNAINGSFNSAFDNSSAGNGSNSSKLAQLLASATSGIGEISFRYSEPPDPMRNDNQGVPSDSDSDNENTLNRNRRVNFSGIGEDSRPLDSPDNNSFSSYSAPITTEESEPNAILRSLLAKPSDEKYSEKEHPKNRDYGLGCCGNVEPTAPLESPIYNEGSPLKHLLGNSDVKNENIDENLSRTNTPTSITPTPSELSQISQSGSHASSGSGTKRETVIDMNVLRKSQNEGSFVKPGRAPSDASTLTCNETRDSLEAASDGDEHFQNLSGEATPECETEVEDDEEDEDDDDDDEVEVTANLNPMARYGLKLITLADVLLAMSKTPRTVSDEEIKKYTDFMMWFANVAKSACPHNSKDHKRKANRADEISLASTTSLTPSMAKKRKKPLKKVGTFLLKALMFLLD